ncbi:MAG: hypothetical protein P4L35_20150 [Ignavibacteriaceae bacterium]|nr:hypothetical protein [Ignavibacteriaceae bacterium]
MPKISVVFGVLLSVLGLYGYFGMGRISVTALIPLFIGVPIIFLGILAFDDNKLKHSMHAASVLILLGLIGSVYRLAHKVILGNNDRSSIILIVMSLLCLMFLILAINSFIAARKAREKKQGVE